MALMNQMSHSWILHSLDTDPEVDKFYIGYKLGITDKDDLKRLIKDLKEIKEGVYTPSRLEALDSFRINRTTF